MDSRNGTEGVEKSSTEETAFGSKGKVVGGTEQEVFFRADKIDFKSWDIQLEKHLSRGWARESEEHKQMEEWEIDLSKLDIRHVIAHGTYGTVYRGAYDGQDVAGTLLSLLASIGFPSFSLLRLMTYRVCCIPNSPCFSFRLSNLIYWLSMKFHQK